MSLNPSDRLIEALSLGRGSAAVVYNPSNMYYLTEGYTGEGVVFITEGAKVIVTDFRYTEAAQQQAPGFALSMTDKDHTHERRVAELCEQYGVENLRYEDDYLTVKAFAGLKAAVSEGMMFKPMDRAPEKLREIKTAREADAIREACAITSKAFEQILPKFHEGVTEKEMAIELDFLQLKLGAQGNSFDTIMAFGENGSKPHAIPGDRRLQRGDMITMDFGCKVRGYCSDMTRTVAFGEPSDTMRRVYETVFDAQAYGVSILGPGKNCFEIDKAVRDRIDAAGYAGRFGHGLGHSVGIDIHENPRLSQMCHETVKAGHVLTVEPGVYLPGIGGVRIEDTCLVTETGCEMLTTAPKELIIL